MASPQKNTNYLRRLQWKKATQSFNLLPLQWKFVKSHGEVKIKQKEITNQKKIHVITWRTRYQFERNKFWRLDFKFVASVIIFEVTYLNLFAVLKPSNFQVVKLVRSVLFYLLLLKTIRTLNSNYIGTLFVVTFFKTY